MKHFYNEQMYKMADTIEIFIYNVYNEFNNVCININEFKNILEKFLQFANHVKLDLLAF